MMNIWLKVNRILLIAVAAMLIYLLFCCREFRMASSEPDTEGVDTRDVTDQDLGGYPNEKLILQLYNQTCKDSNYTIGLQPWIQFRSIVLVLLFNNPYYEAIPLVELLYRPFFPRVIYCIPDGEVPKELNTWNLTIIHYNHDPARAGFENYMCVHYVQDLGLQADGYFFLADDILVSPDAVRNFSSTLPAMYSSGQHVCNASHTTESPYCEEWMWFTMCKQQLNQLHADIEKEPAGSLMRRCHDNLQNMTGYALPMGHTSADIYFIPAAFMADISEILRKFYRRRLFLEVAVAHALNCVTWPKRPVDVRGKQVWWDDREDFWKYVTVLTAKARPEYDFVHPMKLSYVKANNSKAIDCFCREVLPYWHKHR